MSDGLSVGHGVNLGIRWQSFRGFEDTGWLRLKPITVLLGSNSSGKSSLITPLLLLKQSLESETGQNALLTRGEYVNVGSFSDFAHDHDDSTTVTFALRWHSHSRRGARRPVGEYAPGGAEFAFIRGSELNQVRLKSYRVEDGYRRIMLSRILRDDDRYTLRVARIPESVRRPDTDQIGTAVKRATRAAARDARPLDFLFTGAPIRQAAIQASLDDDSPTFAGQIDDDRIRFYSQILDAVEWRVTDILDSMYFLGPLREPPKRVYELAGEMPPDVGTRGEHAPEVLFRWRNDDAVMTEVETWLKHFGFIGRPRFEQVGTEGFALGFGPHGRTNSVVDTGFGLSQVLPLIVQGLKAPPGSWLIIEQPEIHLNPRLQAALADLVAALMSRGVGLMIETHSEHFLLRLRRLLADDALSPEQVGLHFVERRGRASVVREVPLDESGYIAPDDWPGDFFGDALRESLALAQAQAARSHYHAAESRR